ncbi:MAG TPA: FAD:protein FMN transferase [Streptosporangiaceae bacterium]
MTPAPEEQGPPPAAAADPGPPPAAPEEQGPPPVAAAKPGPQPAADSWTAIGTTVRLVVTDPRRIEAGRRLLAGYIAALDAACSRFRDDSELADAERRAGTPVLVSELLADAVAVALHAADITDGDLDPTVATQLAALGYDRDFELVTRNGPPLRLTVRSARSGPGWRDVRLDQERRRLTIPPGVRLDLGATAKAHAADRAAARLARRLGCGVLVSLGGDIAVAGKPPEGGWRVRIQDVTGHPEEPPVGPSQVIAITGGGVSTSGIAARRWRRGNQVLHHIVDPRTGLPAKPVWRTVSVLAQTALRANIASTTAIIRGQAGPGWLEGRDVAARLVTPDGRVRTVGAWPRQEEAA